MRLFFLLPMSIALVGGSMGHRLFGKDLTSGESSSSVGHRISKRNPANAFRFDVNAHSSLLEPAPSDQGAHSRQNRNRPKTHHRMGSSSSGAHSRLDPNPPSTIFGPGPGDTQNPSGMHPDPLSTIHGDSDDLEILIQKLGQRFPQQKPAHCKMDESAPGHIQEVGSDMGLGKTQNQDSASKRNPALPIQQTPESTSKPPTDEEIRRFRPRYNVNISGKCLENIVYFTCYGQELTARQEVLIDPAHEEPFECNNCTISKIHEQFCKQCTPQDNGSDPQELRDSRCPSMSSHQKHNNSQVGIPPISSGGSNYNYYCAKFHQRGVFQNVGNDVGWPCENKLRCLCGEFCATGPKPRNKIITLKHLLENAFNLLVHKQVSNGVRFYSVNSTQKNYPMRG